MNKLKSITQETNYFLESDIFSQNDLKKILLLKLPNILKFTRADKYDSKFIDVKNDTWKFKYSGKQRIIKFEQLNEYEKKLIKYIIVLYVQINTPSKIDQLFNVLNGCLNNIRYKKNKVSLNSLKQELKLKLHNQNDYYLLLFFIRQLFSLNFESFNIGKIHVLEMLERPNNNKQSLYYQESINTIDIPTKTLIQKGFINLVDRIDSKQKIPNHTLKNSAILSILFSIGLRPVQIDKLSTDDLKLDTYRKSDDFSRYSLLIPYAKQSRFTHSRIAIKIPLETAKIILAYKEALGLSNEQKLFELGKDAAKSCFESINKQLFEFSPPQYKAAVQNGEVIQRKYFFSEFRHNVGHSLAISGASAEEIAYILGHSSTVTARHYIFSTPELAEIRAKALGKNPLYKQMIYMMMTGYITSKYDWEGKIVIGSIGNKVHYDIGGCSYNSSCQFQPVRNCYGCIYFHPFKEGDHKAVYNSVQSEIEELIQQSDSMNQSKNPLINVHEATKFEIESVINRCKSL